MLYAHNKQKLAIKRSPPWRKICGLCSQVKLHNCLSLLIFISSFATLLFVNGFRERTPEAHTIPAPASFDQALADISGLLGLNLSYIPSAGAFPVPAGPDPALNNFNMTSRIVTDGGLHCLNQATAFSGVKHKVFPAVYSYVFNRTSQPPTYTNGACNAPITPSHPFGDPNMEYFICHAGDVVWPFGVLLRVLPARDEIDIPFSQLILDYWTSFARTYDPNPEISYLKARGYWSSVAQLKVVGEWDEVKTSKPTARWLQWNGKQVPFNEREQCDALGLPLDYYERL